ncbi:hypothetical protein JCM15765_13060 [Paradesulfitobacterium aromaticivorans]
MMIIFGILLVVFLVYVFKPQNVLPNGQPGRRDALEILRERYARGEIEADEFSLRRQELEKY